MADCFIDTNVLLYAVSTNPQEAGKTAMARKPSMSARYCTLIPDEEPQARRVNRTSVYCAA